MNKILIEKLLSALLDDSNCSETQGQTSGDKEMIGDYVIVRCRDAGVHAGYLKSYEGREVVLTESRRLWYWKAANKSHSLSGVAVNGLESTSKITARVEKIILPEACEIIFCSIVAMNSIQGQAIHEVD